MIARLLVFCAAIVSAMAAMPQAPSDIEFEGRLHHRTRGFGGHDFDEGFGVHEVGCTKPTDGRPWALDPPLRLLQHKCAHAFNPRRMLVQTRA